MENSFNPWKLAITVSLSCISGGLLTLAARKFFAKSLDSHKVPEKWLRVGTVKKVIIYPVKSCRGVELGMAAATPIGLKGSSDCMRDRIFMVVDYRYSFQTQRVLPRMTLIQVTVEGDTLTFKAPGMESLTISAPENILKNKRSCRVWEDHVREVLDCGDKIGQWLDTFLEGKGYRLVYHALTNTQRTRTPLQEQFPTFEAFDKGAFQDQTTYMLMSEESIADLNTKLSKEVSYRNFRPSILIEGIMEPYAEDFWSFVKIGKENGPILKTSKPCTRCRLTTVDPNTGEFDEEGDPLKTLLTMKRSFGNDVVDQLVDDMGVIGLQLGLHREGTIRVGDPVYAALL